MHKNNNKQINIKKKIMIYYKLLKNKKSKFKN